MTTIEKAVPKGFEHASSRHNNADKPDQTSNEAHIRIKRVISAIGALPCYYPQICRSVPLIAE